MQAIYHLPHGEPDAFFASLREQARADGRDCIVNAVALRDDGKVLILKRAPTKAFLPNCWDLPGGHVRAGESLEAALRREAREEIGAEIDTLHALIAIWDWEKPTSRPKESRYLRQFEFLVTLVRSALRLDRNDFTEYRWIRQDELAVFSENRRVEDIQMQQVLEHAFQVGARLP
jgi:8-oxo-dGTP pyrophosphatase MutT (NUDIX family)